MSLSEQQMVDCAGSFGPAGCDGGYITDAFLYARAAGAESESAYPYTEPMFNCFDTDAVSLSTPTLNPCLTAPILMP